MLCEGRIIMTKIASQLQAICTLMREVHGGESTHPMDSPLFNNSYPTPLD